MTGAPSPLHRIPRSVRGGLGVLALVAAGILVAIDESTPAFWVAFAGVALVFGAIRNLSISDSDGDAWSDELRREQVLIAGAALAFLVLGVLLFADVVGVGGTQGKVAGLLAGAAGIAAIRLTLVLRTELQRANTKRKVTL